MLLLQTRITSHPVLVIVALAAPGLCASTLSASAAPAAKHVPRPADGVFHVVKSQPDGLETHADMGIGNGGRG